MNKLIFRLFLLIISGVFLFIYAFPWNAYNIEVPFSGGKEYKLWLDLQWWIELDYKVDLEKAKLEEDYDSKKEKEIIEWLKAIIDKRIETLKLNDSVITSANYWWEQHIIVQIPMKWNDSMENKENIEKAKKAIWKVVKIEFKEQRFDITPEDLEERKIISEKILSELKESEYDFSVTADKYKNNYENVVVWIVKKIEELWVSEDVIKEKIWLVDEIIDYKDSEWEKWKYIIKIEEADDKTIVINYVFVMDKVSKWMPAKDSNGRILNDKYFIKAWVQFNEAVQPMM